MIPSTGKRYKENKIGSHTRVGWSGKPSWRRGQLDAGTRMMRKGGQVKTLAEVEGRGRLQSERPPKALSQADLGQSRLREKATVAGMQ